MKKTETKKDLTTLLIKLNECNERLYRIKNNPEYIEERTKEIFKNKPKKDYTAEIMNLLNDF